jgi:hypothetical protein
MPGLGVRRAFCKRARAVGRHAHRPRCSARCHWCKRHAYKNFQNTECAIGVVVSQLLALWGALVQSLCRTATCVTCVGGHR